MEARNASNSVRYGRDRENLGGSELPCSASLAALPTAGSGGKSTLMTRGFISSITEKEPAANKDTLVLHKVLWHTPSGRSSIECKTY